METIDLINSELLRLRDSLKLESEAELRTYEKAPIKKATEMIQCEWISIPFTS